MRHPKTLLWIALALSGAATADDVSNERVPKQGLDVGKAAYLANCAACHQPEGVGMAGAFPPLAGSDFLKNNDKQKVLASILKGITGEITVNGQKFNGVMPAMSHLTDADVANIVTFIYASWGNPGGAIGHKDVAAARKTLAVSTDPARRAVCGLSSSGLAAFNVAWERPDAFGNVITHCGSFVDIRGGHAIIPAVRRHPRKPLRVFQQTGRHDLDIVFGHWLNANRDLAAALDYHGYPHRLEVGEGGHSLLHGGAILPDTLRWIFAGDAT